MAHTYRNKSQANGQSATSISHDHTPGAAATVAILSIVVEGTTARTGAAPSIAGVSATQADSTRVGLETNVELWYLCAYFSGAQFTWTIPNDGSLTLHIECVTADAGTGYTSQLTNANGAAWADDTADGGTVSVTSSATGDFLYARLGCGEAATGSVAESSTNPTKTLSYANDHGAYTSYGYYAVSDGAGSESFTWTWTNDDGVVCAAAFKSNTSLLVDASDDAVSISENRIVAIDVGPLSVDAPDENIALADTPTVLLGQLVPAGLDAVALSDLPEVKLGALAIFQSDLLEMSEVIGMYLEEPPVETPPLTVAMIYH